MRQLIVSFPDPHKEKVVTELLEMIEGVEVARAPKPAKKAARTKAKLKLTPKEKKFMKELSGAFKEVNDHLAGKKKLKSAREFLNEL